MSGICQDCKEQPATWGDGVTWERCSACQQKFNTTQPEEAPVEEQPQIKGDGIAHEIVPGLVSIVMPVYMMNYSLFHLTGNCIGTVKQNTSKDLYELVIVDNGSEIQPPSLESFYADKIIQNETNLGVTKAWNQGIRMSQGEYIVLLNNDTQVYEGWLEDLLEELKDVDLVMAHPMYSNTEPFARAIEARHARTGLKKFDALGRDFSCVIFRRNLFEKLEDDYMFDERLFSYCSDVDLYERMDAKGLKYRMSEKVFIHHISDATGFAMQEKTNDIMDQDKITMDQIRKERNSLPSPVLGSPPSSGEVGKFIRCNLTGDRVFLVKDNKTHPINDPDTLKALGGDFSMVETISREEFGEYSMGDKITMENVNNYA